MSRFINWVPPLDLCEKIPYPKKNFRDSCLAWVPRFKGRGCFREIAYYELLLRPEINDSQCIPAPTLMEILTALPSEICESKYYLMLLDSRQINTKDWQIGYARFPCSGGLVAHDVYKAHDQNMTTAALMLWLSLNGGK